MAFEDMVNDRTTPIRGGTELAVNDPVPVETRILWIGTGGTLRVTFDDGSTVTLQNVPDGVALPAHVASIDWVTTTCADMVALR